MNADVWSAIATWVGAAAALVAAWVAVKTLKAIRDDSADRSRPVVIAELIIPPLGDHQMNFVVSNQGSSGARNLKITFDPDPLILPNDSRPATLATYLTRRYASTIPLLGVGSRLSNVYATSESGGKISEPLPTTFKVRVEYSDMERRRTYEDTFELNLDVLATATFARPGGDKYDRRAAMALESIARGVGDI